MDLTSFLNINYSRVMARIKKEKSDNQSVLDAVSELVQAVGTGFDKVDRRFDQVDKCLMNLRRLETIKRRLGIER